MSKKEKIEKDTKPKVQICEAFGIRKITKPGYYKVLNIRCFDDNTFEIIDESIEQNINACEDMARRAIFSYTLELQQGKI